MNKIIFISTLFVISFCFTADAQCQIMDSKISWSSGSGTLNVYLADTDGLSGLQIDLGHASDTLNIYNSVNTITGNTFGSGGTVTGTVLSIPIGSYATNSDYYVRIRVLLTNSSYNEMEIYSHN